MKITSLPGRSFQSAFSLVEVMIGVLIVGTSFISLYTGITSGFGVVQVARENLRATQILQEKMETIRLYNWDQVNSNGFLPASFAAPFYSTGSSTNSGITYRGTMTIGPAPVSEAYSNDLRLVTVNVQWRSGEVDRRREMQTFVSRYGLQNYIY